MKTRKNQPPRTSFPLVERISLRAPHPQQGSGSPKRIHTHTFNSYVPCRTQSSPSSSSLDLAPVESDDNVHTLGRLQTLRAHGTERRRPVIVQAVQTFSVADHPALGQFPHRPHAPALVLAVHVGGRAALAAVAIRPEDVHPARHCCHGYLSFFFFCSLCKMSERFTAEIPKVPSLLCCQRRRIKMKIKVKMRVGGCDGWVK